MTAKILLTCEVIWAVFCAFGVCSSVCWIAVKRKLYVLAVVLPPVAELLSARLSIPIHYFNGGLLSYFVYSHADVQCCDFPYALTV